MPRKAAALLLFALSWLSAFALAWLYALGQVEADWGGTLADNPAALAGVGFVALGVAAGVWLHEIK